MWIPTLFSLWHSPIRLPMRCGIGCSPKICWDPTAHVSWWGRSTPRAPHCSDDTAKRLAFDRTLLLLILQRRKWESVRRALCHIIPIELCYHSNKILESVLKELPKELQIYGKPGKKQNLWVSSRPAFIDLTLLIGTYRSAISKAKCQALTCDMYDVAYKEDMKKHMSEKRKISIVYRYSSITSLNPSATQCDNDYMFSIIKGVSEGIAKQ